MTITMKQVIDLLKPDEPKYRKAAEELGPDALPHLENIVNTADPMLASKATYLASIIQDERSVNILKLASQSAHPWVRSSAASGCQHLHFQRVKEVLETLKNDQDAGIRMKALKLLER